ncbi:MAG: hypothetical protein ACYTG6_08100 [Planctomycetota bacterium]|jgi:hypothetical protein
MKHLSMRATRALSIALFVLVVGGVPGCGHGGGGYHHVRARGTLEVYNVPTSFAAVDGVETELSYDHHGTFHPVFAPPGTGVFFDLVADPYDVTVHWDNGEFDTFFDVHVHPYHTTSLSVRY